MSLRTRKNSEISRAWFDWEILSLEQIRTDNGMPIQMDGDLPYGHAQIKIYSSQLKRDVVFMENTFFRSYRMPTNDSRGDGGSRWHKNMNSMPAQHIHGSQVLQETN